MRDRRYLLLALVPAAMGGLAALVLAVGWLPNPLQRVFVFWTRAGLLLLAGGLLTLVLFIGLLGLWLGSGWGWRRGAAGRMALTQDAHAFYARLDHELKNPLQAIYSSLENIGKRERLSEQGRGSLRTAYSEVRHLKRLIEDLRKIASLPTRPVNMQDLDMADLTAGTVAAIQERYPAAEKGGADRLVLHLEDKSWQPLTVHGDPDLLSQMLYNVIDNACKFSPPDAPVEIWCIPDGDWVRVKVVDRGQGIPLEDLPYLGQDLFRSAAARGMPGYGLGLAMVKGILARHNGEWDFESKVGQGTAVSLRLPRVGRLPVQELG